MISTSKIIRASRIAVTVSGKRTTEGIGSKIAAAAPVVDVILETGLTNIQLELYGTYHNDSAKEIVSTAVFKEPEEFSYDCQIQEPFRSKGK